ncbi:MAG: hypothetical protein JXR58_09625 [Bacteroidales bacterium]|nr:hypothetical protein [Bacteroidales bacterium]
MKDLEKIFLENQEAFNSEEPENGHFERFEKKLKSPKKVLRFNYWYSLAAVFVIVILSVLYAYERVQNSEQQTVELSNEYLALKDVSPEYAEVEFFLASQVEEGMSKIEQIDFFNNPAEKQMLLDELKAMDSVYTNLQKELNANPNDERIIEAMIQYYRTKVIIMNNIINKFEQLKTRKNESTEI